MMLKKLAAGFYKALYNDTAANTVSVVCSSLYQLKPAPGDLCDTDWEWRERTAPLIRYLDVFVK